jgi:tellurite resistance-related uncharacterized protein
MHGQKKYQIFKTLQFVSQYRQISTKLGIIWKTERIPEALLDKYSSKQKHFIQRGN